MKKKSLRHMSVENRLFYLFNSVFWIVIMFIVIYPLYLICIASISDPDAVAKGQVLLLPVDISFIGYKAILKDSEIWVGYVNSLFYVASSVVLSVIVTLCAAYSLSRKNLSGKKFFNMYFVIPMFFAGGLIPTFLTMKDIGLYNTRWVMVLMGCLSSWNLMVARTYIQTNIPDELYEAAVLDGASHFQFFSKIVLPLSKTIMAVLAVYYGVAKWNDYFTGLVYLRKRELMPLQTILRGVLATLEVDVTETLIGTLMAEGSLELLEESYQIAHVVKYCAIVISTLPVVLLYVLLQKYFEKGVMIGSVKG